MNNTYRIKKSSIPRLIGKTLLYVRESAEPNCCVGRILDDNAFTGDAFVTIARKNLEPLEESK